MTTSSEDTRVRLAVVVGADRPAATRVFGGSFDRMLTTTYEDLVTDLEHEPDPAAFVGIAAGPGMEPAVDAALVMLAEADATGRRAPEVAVEVPWDLDALDHLRERLTGGGAALLTDVRRYRDRPCVVLGGSPAPVDDPSWVVGALLTAGTTAPDERVAEQERVAGEWERASAHAEVARRDAEIDRLRAEVDRLRSELGRARTRLSQATPVPSAEPAPAAGPRAAVRGLLAAAGRRLDRGPRTGALVVASSALLVLLAPPVLLALLAGAAGAAVGLALGATLLACAGLAAAVLLAHRRTSARLEALQRALAQAERAPRLAAAQAGPNPAPELAPGEAPAGGPRDDEALVAAVHQTRAAVAEEALATRRSLQALLALDGVARPRAGLPPLGGAEVAPDVALEAVSQLLLTRPTVAVVTGSAASALLLALAAREHGLSTRVLALEHDAHAALAARDLFARHGVADSAEVRWAPLARVHVTGHLTPWYDEAALEDLREVGLLVVHGPADEVGPAARFPAVPLLRDRLADRCSVLLDAAADPDQHEVGQRWARLLPGFSVEELAVEGGGLLLSRR